MFKAELKIVKFEEDIITASDDGIILPDHDWEAKKVNTVFDSTVCNTGID